MPRTLPMQCPDPGGAARRREIGRAARLVVALCLALACALAQSLVTVETVQAQRHSTHVVQSGETLGQIAQRYGVGWRELAQWNGIGDPSRIYPGQVLTLYAGGGQSWSGGSPGQAQWSGNTTAFGASNAGASSWGGATATGGTHVVQAGETLVSIAQRYGVTPPQLVRANNLSSPPAIYPGQTLILPGGASAGSTWGSAPAGQSQASAQAAWHAPQPVARPAQQGGTSYGVSAPQAPTQVGKVILISIAQQYLWAFENGRLVLQTPVTTGRPGADTPTGTYTILEKYSPYRFISPFPLGHEFYYDPVDSNYSLRITWHGHHIHDAPWRSDFGPGTNLPHNNSRGQWATGSIGCVNVPTSAMAQLYNWADRGIQVVIQ